ncbi:MAG: TetR/AcrR family transcriptional regulator [Myxococcales bacterium]|nr:TetR/AcrR family transcriptional regulator [Myxococcales bacterium]MCB9630024.1 TetR/AcrR family transcriptional regulator [Sandaracinaceae bacterium]
MSVVTSLRVAAIGSSLPPRPPAELDPYLDAAERCVTRYGWSRTSPKDIAAEAGVERTTIYRYLGAKEQIWQLLVAREVHRTIELAMESVTPARQGPEVVVDVVCMGIKRVLDNPMAQKVLADDPELVGGFLHRDFADVIERISNALAPFVAASMRAGHLAQRDPLTLSQWVIRVAITLVLAPQPGPLRPFVAAMLLPVLQPADRPTQNPPSAKTRRSSR